jgi:hypothetical protein
VKKIPNNGVVAGQIRILKRGEEIPKKTSDLVVEAIPKKTSGLIVEAIPKKIADLEKPDLGSTRRIGPDPAMIPSQIRLAGRRSKKSPLYAGPVTMTSPPPSDVPLPAFTMKKSVSLFQTTDATHDLTNGLIRMLRLDIA